MQSIHQTKQQWTTTLHHYHHSNYISQLNKMSHLTPRQIAFERLNSKGRIGSYLVGLLKEATSSWKNSMTTRHDTLSAKTKNFNEKNNAISASDLSYNVMEPILERNGGLECAEEKKMEDGSETMIKLPPITTSSLNNHLYATQNLLSLLNLYSSLSRLDPILSEEMAREGGHAVISSILRWERNDEVVEGDDDDDVISEIQELACCIASSSSFFPMRYSPFSEEELEHRLPKLFNIHPIGTTAAACDDDDDNYLAASSTQILMNQVTCRQSAQEDVGFVLWPSSVILTRWILTNPSVIRNKHILELGAGCGLVGIAIALMKTCCHSITLSDFNDTVLKNITLNIYLNDVVDVATCQKLDFYDNHATTHDDCDDGDDNNTTTPTNPSEKGYYDLIVAADVICNPSDATAVAQTIKNQLASDGEAVVICANAEHRFGVDTFATECVTVGLQVVCQDVADLYGGALLWGEEMDMTAGYVDTMRFTFFRVTHKNDSGVER